jgi:MFS family permease
MGSMIPDFINRNLIVLFICQMIFVSGSVLIATVGGIVGHALAATSSLATLPVAVMVVGTASATIPASLVMQRIRRRWGFILATGIAASGAALCGLALREQSFWMFCTATGLVGFSLGFSQQFRFAAAESVPVDRVSHAASFILLGSIAGAFIGPVLVTQPSSANADSPYALAFKLLIVLYAVGAIALLSLKTQEVETENDETTGQPGRWGRSFGSPCS